MSARVRRRGEQQNLDSLLDTMANVTGILVVLMAVIQISVGDAMERLRDQLLARPELSRDALSAAAEEAASLQLALAPQLGRREELEASRREGRAELSALRSQIAELERDLGKLGSQPRTAAEADRRLASARGRARDLEHALARERAATAALEREIAAIPLAGTSREARLPDTRPAPPGAAPIIYAARHGRIVQLDPRELVATLDSAVWRATHATDLRSLGASPVLRAQVVEFFEIRDVGDANLRWRVFEESGELVAHLEWRRDDLGETADQLASAGSQFRAELARLDRHRMALQFLVWDDSFDAYLAARKIADRGGFAAGWDPFSTKTPLRHYITNGRARGVVID